MRSIVKLGAACAFAVLLLLPSLVFAQAALTGTVKDTSGAVLPGVTVEAASPVLIEKVRTAVTDGNGRFQMVDLRPGAYTVTFTLAGFNTFKRDGVTISGTGVTTVDADLRVGALEETITVTGEAPVVDTQSLTQQKVLNADTIDALPSARNYFGVARMIPGTQGGGNDVGGSLIQDVGQSLTVHGSRNVDQRITINGVNTMTLQAGGNIGGQTPDMGSAAEVTVDTTSLGADLPTGGVRVNFVPKDGGNVFTNSTFFSFTNSGLQGNNYSDALKAQGLGTPNKIQHSYDVNESLGGPFKRDKVWFWFSTRYNDVANEAAVLQNANAFNPNVFTYVPIPGQPGVNKGTQINSSIRVTWQATPRNKIAGTYKADTWCNCPNNISATQAPEAARDRRFPRLRQEHLEWTSPVTNKLLLEAVGMHLFERWGNMHMRSTTGSVTDAQAAIIPQLIGVQNQDTGLNYRVLTNYNNTAVPSFTYRVGASYVTGSHAVKIGWNNTQGYLDENQYVFQPTSYRYSIQNGIYQPNRITYRQNYRVKTNLDADMGFYAQDRWTMNRLTVAGAIRFDNFRTSYPAQSLGPDILAPNRNYTTQGADVINWKDLTYRSGFSYDVFGTGKTAVKVAFNKYLLGQTLNGLGRDPNPAIVIGAATANRSWADANLNNIPDCVLTNLAANGECGALDNQNFGSNVATAKFDPDLLTGFNNRQANWEFSATVAHELMPRVAVDVGYFRRAWANFRVTDNLAIERSQFREFNYNAPAVISAATGETIAPAATLTGFAAPSSNVIDNYNTLSSKFGDGAQTEVWQGMDFGVNMRLLNGLTLNGGVSTGTTKENDCGILTQLPEMRYNSTITNNQRPLQFCDRQTPWLTQAKIFGTYTVPKVDVQVSGTFRNVNGTDINANFSGANAANLAANSTLVGAPTQTLALALLEPYSEYTDRRNELDLRVGKVVRFGRARSVISWDFFNALNNDAAITLNQSANPFTPAANSFRRPQEILNARVMKFTVSFDF
ncbi:MAG: carboxypeptidase regulatory-like domain-containing protein [Vicinamibacterales bacterium]